MQKMSPKNEYSLQATRTHCHKLNDIGVIYQTMSPSYDDPSPRWSGEYIKFWFVVENVIEICAILTAATVGRDRNFAIQTKEELTRMYEQNPGEVLMLLEALRIIT